MTAEACYFNGYKSVTQGVSGIRNSSNAAPIVAWKEIYKDKNDVTLMTEDANWDQALLRFIWIDPGAE